MARASWSGTIVLPGLPPFPVRAYSIVKSRSSDSFKGLCACHKQPIAMPKRCAIDDSTLTPDRVLKGAEIGKGQYVEVTIDRLPSSASIQPLAWATDVDLSVATANYRLTGDKKLPGSDQALALLYAVTQGKAMIAEIVMRAGSRDNLVAIWAAQDGLRMSVLPWQDDLADAPESDIPKLATAVDPAQVAALETLAGVKPQPFDRKTFVSSWHARKNAAIEAAIKGEPVKNPIDSPAPAVPDLMAALTASLQAAGASPAPAAEAVHA